MITKTYKGRGKSLNLQRGMAIRCIQKEKDYCIYKILFCINLMATTHTQETKKTKTKTKQKQKQKTP